MAGRIRQSDVEEVKARTNIADIVGDYVSLKSAGVGSMKGLCPFHDERSPSFHVRPQVGFYHCFGCGESGDVYSFLQKMDHVTFAEAVERLAGRIGFELRYEDGGAAPEQGNRARILAANTAAEEFFTQRLSSPDAEIGRRFLGERGFDAAAATLFGVGFAPKSWDELTNHLRSRGFSTEEITASGLVSSRDGGGVYDRFRGRLVWPIRDVTGQTIGFGARRLLDDDKGPKYLNTPETPVYHKAQVLYGLDLAKREISRSQRVVVVEGYTDVMACHLAGVTTAVATCGTSFGVDHIKVLRRVLGDDSGVGEVIFTFDPDAAGQKAAMRAFTEERRFAAQTYIAVGPEGLDPCDLRLQRGDAAVQRMIDTKKPMFEFMIRQVLSRYDLETVEGRVSALRAAAPVVAEIRDPSLRPGYTRELARMLGTDLPEVTRAVASGHSTQAAQPTTQQTRAASRAGEQGAGADELQVHTESGPTLFELQTDPGTRLERDALMALLQYPALVGTELAQRAVHSGFDNSTLAVVRDGIAGCLDALESADWLTRVMAEVPAAFGTLVRELAVAPIPERSERELTAYVRGVASALVDKDLTRRKRELLGQLQRADAGDRDAYNTLQRALMQVEAERRSLREE
jgi:DNA primase